MKNSNKPCDYHQPTIKNLFNKYKPCTNYQNLKVYNLLFYYNLFLLYCSILQELQAVQSQFISLLLQHNQAIGQWISKDGRKWRSKINHLHLSPQLKCDQSPMFQKEMRFKIVCVSVFSKNNIIFCCSISSSISKEKCFMKRPCHPLSADQVIHPMALCLQSQVRCQYQIIHNGK